ncbi:hypothetical protein Poli38472_014597 [Pythium oligandrum]|uniref:Ankyrin repeat protein n=1 Tax=Pythium oligandrum TaxID=41045 RepID=A0A8K1CMZ9_PYTOL|nr:hypothetical protein Poli38472_014597 [Pythium oligandrum]|eukprot:TMW66621.1 hypothetical protein Poli38472_014597 [Pythium oligandrum]
MRWSVRLNVGKTPEDEETATSVDASRLVDQEEGDNNARQGIDEEHHFCCDEENASLSMLSAAQYGRIEVRERLWTSGAARVHVLIESLLAAVKGGSLEAVRWFDGRVTTVWPTKILDVAAEHGQLAIVKYLHTNRTDGCTTDAMDLAAKHGHVTVILWLHVNRTEGCTTGAMDQQNTVTWTLCDGCMRIGRKDWLHENRAEGCTTNAMDDAAGHGHLDTLRWLHVKRTEGCTKNAMDLATQNGHLNVLRWLHSNRIERWLEEKTSAWLTLVVRVGLSRSNRTEGCSVNAMDGAARNGHLAVVQWLFANRKEGFTPGAMDSAAEHGHLDVVIWLHASRREGCTTDAMDCAEAQFEADLKGVEAAFDVDEDTFRSKEPMFSLTTTWIDLAAIYGSSYLSDAHASMDLIGEEHRVSCSVSGLYGAILRGHLGNVKQIHKRQRELGNWPALEDGADAIRSLMSPVKRKDRLLS